MISSNLGLVIRRTPSGSQTARPSSMFSMIVFISPVWRLSSRLDSCSSSSAFLRTVMSRTMPTAPMISSRPSRRAWALALT